MRFGSVCSGIEAASVAWHPLGWRAAWFAEIDTFPSAVLAHRWPGIPNHGDFTRISDAGAIDLLVGGTPCQSFSVAGLRGGLADARGNLALEFCRLARGTRARWVVWENVPGVLSADGGRAFGSILGALVELGYGIAYRVLDAQYFGVPQRRRRVFVVGHLGDWRRAAAVLSERAGLRWDPPPRRAPGSDVAGTLGAGAGGFGGDLDRCGSFIPERAHTLRAQPNLSHHDEKDTLIAHTLRGEGFDASEDGTGRGTPLVPVDISNSLLGRDISSTLMAAQSKGNRGIGVLAYDFAQITSAENRANPKPGDPAPPLAALGKPTVAFHHTQDPISGDVSPCLGTGADGMGLMSGAAVRRLTPRECERLQGFPDDYTLIPGASDSARYKACGNSMAVPVMRWIGERIEKVDSIPETEAA